MFCFESARLGKLDPLSLVEEGAVAGSGDGETGVQEEVSVCGACDPSTSVVALLRSIGPEEETLLLDMVVGERVL